MIQNLRKEMKSNPEHSSENTNSKLMEFNKVLCFLEQETYTVFIRKGVKGLDDIDLITVHGLLTRCEHTLDKQRKFIDLVEDELLLRMNKKR